MSSQKILIIDDEENITIIVKATLEDRYDVATTTSALTAFKYLSKNTVDLIILDINMPQMNGIEALREIKKAHPEIIIIMLTAYASQTHISTAKMLGAYGFIEKPFNIDELREFVDRVLSQNIDIERTI